MQQVKKIKRRPNPRKDIKELMKIRKNVKKKLQQTTDPIQKRHLKDRKRIMQEHIADKKKPSRSNKTKKITEDFRTNLDNGGKICEVRMKITTKRQIKVPKKGMESIKLFKTHVRLSKNVKYITKIY